MRVLLVEPEFPIPSKSKNHKDFLPVGLLKFASYHRENGDAINIVRGNKVIADFVPEEIKRITGINTYNELLEEAKKEDRSLGNFIKHRLRVHLENEKKNTLG